LGQQKDLSLEAFKTTSLPRTFKERLLRCLVVKGSGVTDSISFWQRQHLPKRRERAI
jgi:hypothetical protein